MAGVHKYKDDVVAGLYKGLQGLVASRKVTYIEGEGRLSSPTSVDVNGQRVQGRHVLLATGSVPKSLPGLDDRRRPHHLLRPRAGPGPGPEVGDHPGRRRHRRRVRLRVEVLRHRRHHRRGPASTWSRSRTRTAPSFWSAPSASAASSSTWAPSSEGRVHPATASRSRWRTARVRGRGAARRRRPRPGLRGPGLRGAGRRAWTAATSWSTSTCAPTCPTISAVGDLVPTLQLAHVGFAEGILVAERLAGLKTVPIDYDGVPARDVLPPRGRLRRHHRGQGQGDLRRGQGRRPEVQPRRATARARSSRPRARSSSSRSGTVRWSASTWSVTAWASRSARPS